MKGNVERSGIMHARPLHHGGYLVDGSGGGEERPQAHTYIHMRAHMHTAARSQFI